MRLGYGTARGLVRRARLRHPLTSRFDNCGLRILFRDSRRRRRNPSMARNATGVPSKNHNPRHRKVTKHCTKISNQTIAGTYLYAPQSAATGTSSAMPATIGESAISTEDKMPTLLFYLRRLAERDGNRVAPGFNRATLSHLRPTSLFNPGCFQSGSGVPRCDSLLLSSG